MSNIKHQDIRKFKKELFERLDAGEDLTQICEDPKMPCIVTVYTWRSKNKNFDVELTNKLNMRKINYPESVFDEVLERHSLGESLTKITNEPHMPSKAHFYKKVYKDPEYKQKYEEARQCNYSIRMDEVIDIADDDSGDIDENGKGQVVKVQRDKLKIDTRKTVVLMNAGRELTDPDSQNVTVNLYLPDNNRDRNKTSKR